MKNPGNFLIIGGGIIGSAIAYELAKTGQSVTLLHQENRDQDASSAAAGMLSAQEAHARETHPTHFAKLLLQSRSLFPTLIPELEKLTQINTGYQRNGLRFVVTSKEEFKSVQKQIRWQKKQGVSVKWFDAEQTRKAEPWLDQPNLIGSYLFPDDAQIDNAQLAKAFLKAAQKLGTQVIHDSVTRLICSKNQVDTVQTRTKKHYQANHIIIANGSWAGKLLGIPFKIPVFPVRGQMLAFGSKKKGIQRPILYQGGYVVPREKNSFFVGTTVEPNSSTAKVTQSGLKKIVRASKEVTSFFDKLTPTRRWAGLRPATPDHLPILGKTPLQNLFIATGHYRSGILLAPITAKLMTELVLKGKTSISLKPYNVGRF